MFNSFQLWGVFQIFAIVLLMNYLRGKRSDMTKEEFLAIAAQRYDALQSLNELDNFYDYEKQFVIIWKDLGREVLEKNISELPNDKRKKKDADHYPGAHQH